MVTLTMKLILQVVKYLCRREPSFRLSGETSLIQFSQQPARCFHPLIFTVFIDVDHRVSTIAVFGEKDRLPYSYITKNLTIVSELRYGFNIRHKKHTPFSMLTIYQIPDKINDNFYE